MNRNGQALRDTMLAGFSAGMATLARVPVAIFTAVFVAVFFAISAVRNLLLAQKDGSL